MSYIEMGGEMILLQEVWEAAGGHPEIKATKEEVLLVLNLLDQCVDEQDEDIKKLDKEVEGLKFLLKEALPWLNHYEDCHGTPEEVTLLARIIEGKLK